MTLLSCLQQFLQSFAHAKKFVIAYSGGMDSHVLLDLCMQLKSQGKHQFRVIHINHQLSPQANQWATHCQTVCQQYEIDFAVHTLQITNRRGASLENLARKKRYQLFAEHMLEDEILLTAHHEDDQAETVILQLIRGAGPKGLSAMPTTKKFAYGHHARPLLNITRKDLRTYANKKKLIWIDDESNDELYLRRNFIRKKVMPVLQSQLPNVSRCLARAARHCAQADNLLHDFANEMLQTLQGERPGNLSVKKLLQLTSQQQTLVLRTWIKQHAHLLPSEKKMHAIKNELLRAAGDKNPRLLFGETELRRYRDDIFLFDKTQSLGTRQEIIWDFSADLIIPNIGILQSKKIFSAGLTTQIKKVIIKFREGGERIVVNGKRRRLKNCLQDWGVPVWERENLPLIYADNRIVSVANYFVDRAFTAKENEAGYQITFVKKINPTVTRGINKN